MSTRSVFVLQHGPTTPLGWLGDVLNGAGIGYQVVRVDTGEPLPDPGARDGLVVLGGAMSAYEEDRYPFLATEKVLLQETADAGVPVLGICLGCQLLAEALGGRVYLGERMEAGYVPLRLTPAGKADPVLSALADPVLSFHSDTWDVPPGAELLAESDNYPQAFRRGATLAVQFHAEASPDIVDVWARDSEQGLLKIGVDRSVLATEARQHEAEARRRAEDLFGRWIEQLGDD